MSRPPRAFDKIKMKERQKIDFFYSENIDLKVQKSLGWQQEQAGAELDQAGTRWNNLLKTASQGEATPHSQSGGAR